MSLQCKARLLSSSGENDEIRRFKVDEDVATNFEYLKSKVVSTFPNIKDGNIRLFWKDNEGDHIEFNSDEELVDALGQTRASSDLFHIIIKKKCKQAEKSSNSHNNFSFSHSFPREFGPDYHYRPDPRFDAFMGHGPQDFMGWGSFRPMPDYSQGQFPYMPQHTDFMRPPFGAARFMGPRGAQEQAYRYPGYSAGDGAFGAWGQRGPYGTYSSSWMTANSDGNTQSQMQQQRQENGTNEKMSDGSKNQ